MRFGYLRDPLFLVCVALYFVNRWVLEPHVGWRFCTDYLNDCICIPFWVPVTVQLTAWCGVRRSDGPPEAHEILIPLLIWSAVFEVVLPSLAAFEGRAIADPVDVLCYSLGALGASVFWGAWYGGRPYANRILNSMAGSRCASGVRAARAWLPWRRPSASGSSDRGDR